MREKTVINSKYMFVEMKQAISTISTKQNYKRYSRGYQTNARYPLCVESLKLERKCKEWVVFSYL